MKKVLCIVGPTAAGKTKLAVHLAKKLNGILINFDSVQVYQGLSVIAGKDISENAHFITDGEKIHLDLGKIKPTRIKQQIGYYYIESVPIFLLDIVPPTYSFNIGDFLALAPPLIKMIQKAGYLPILVGGSGFYLKALVDGVPTVQMPPDSSLRDALSKVSIDNLIVLLKKKNTHRYEIMNPSDRRNPRRLIRAIEIEEYLANHQHLQKKENHLSQINDFLMIGLSASRPALTDLIAKRIEKRITQGAFKEAQDLFRNFNKLSYQVKTACGYSELFSYLQGTITPEEAIDQWKKSEIKLTKRQMTFFKKDKRILWFDIQEQNVWEKIENHTASWYTNRCSD